jgi:UDP-2,3-diacylglucosamine pyrophosphatase LpxH
MLDAVILSDLHLGSDNCQAKSICDFLERIERDEIVTRQLILNGDVFDSMDFRRLKRSHWKVLSLIRKLSDQLEIIWLCGNHDGSAEIISHLLGVEVRDDYILESGKERLLILHGHVFDAFLDNHPILTWIADSIYWMLQFIDRSHYLAKVAKKGSKTFLRCAKKIEDRSIAMAKRRNCTIAICGHTHVAAAHTDQPVPYFNSGCWTELPCHYLTVKDGVVELHKYVPVEKIETKEPAAQVPALIRA